MKPLSTFCKSIIVGSVLWAAVPAVAASEMTTVTIEPDTVSTLRNPLTGWVM